MNFDGSNVLETTVDPEIRIAAQYYDTVQSTIWVCGHTPVSVIGKLRGVEDYEIVFSSQDNEQLVSITQFHEKIFVADAGYQGGIFYLDNEGLHKTPFSDVESLGAARYIQAEGEILWTLFEKALIRYDGQIWETFRHPDHL